MHADGLRCPDDITIVGFNDMPFVDQLSPPLTTVRLPQYEVGVQAAQLLLDRLANPGSSAKTVILARVSLASRAQDLRTSAAGRVIVTQAVFPQPAGEKEQHKAHDRRPVREHRRRTVLWCDTEDYLDREVRDERER